MKVSTYTIINSKGAVRTTKHFPSLARDEICIHQTLDIPASVFRSPVIEANIDIKEGQVITPQIAIEIRDDLRTILAKKS